LLTNDFRPLSNYSNFFFRREDFGSEVPGIFSNFSRNILEPVLQMTLRTDEKLTDNAKAIEAEKMEKKRQEDIEKHNQVSKHITCKSLSTIS
jgi:hypothetical protein